MAQKARYTQLCPPRGGLGVVLGAQELCRTRVVYVLLSCHAILQAIAIANAATRGENPTPGALPTGNPLGHLAPAHSAAMATR